MMVKIYFYATLLILSLGHISCAPTPGSERQGDDAAKKKEEARKKLEEAKKKTEELRKKLEQERNQEEAKKKAEEQQKNAEEARKRVLKEEELIPQFIPALNTFDANLNTFNDGLAIKNTEWPTLENQSFTGMTKAQAVAFLQTIVKFDTELQEIYNNVHSAEANLDTIIIELRKVQSSKTHSLVQMKADRNVAARKEDAEKRYMILSDKIRKKTQEAAKYINANP